MLIIFNTKKFHFHLFVCLFVCLFLFLFLFSLISEYADLGISQLNKKIHDILIDAPYNITSESTHPLLTDPMIINNGPMWTRFFSLKEENQDVCEELSKVLKTTKVYK